MIGICTVHQNMTYANFLQVAIDYLLHVCPLYANELLCVKIQIAVYITSSANSHSSSWWFRFQIHILHMWQCWIIKILDKPTYTEDHQCCTTAFHCKLQLIEREIIGLIHNMLIFNRRLLNRKSCDCVYNLPSLCGPWPGPLAAFESCLYGHPRWSP